MASGISKFKFISPGIFINEIDDSKLPADPQVDPGPTIIGRARKGPGMRPLTVSSFDEFVQVYGTPDPGAEGGDSWRNNDFDGATYGPYAAQAWLNSEQSPINFVRLLGTESPLNDGSSAAMAGWTTDISTATSTYTTNGGAYGLFLIDSGSFAAIDGIEPAIDHCNTGSLAAVWYLNSGFMTLTGTIKDGTSTLAADVTSSAGTLFASKGANSEFSAVVYGSDGAIKQKTCFNLDRASDKYIRKVFNTNAAQTNSGLVSTTSPSYYTYWLGETYDQFFNSRVSGSAAGTTIAYIAALESGTVNKADMQSPYVNAQTPVFFGQDLSDADQYTETSMQELFHFVARDLGASAHDYKVSIQGLQAAPYPAIDPYGTFNVVIRRAEDNDGRQVVVERFDGCNLNPLSENYVAAQIGDRYTEWDTEGGRFRHFGTYNSRSTYVRVVMNSEVEAGSPAIAQQLPVGYFAPYVYQGFSVFSGSDNLGAFNATTASISSAATAILTLMTASTDIPAFVTEGAACAGAVLTTTTIEAHRTHPQWVGKYEFPTFVTRVSASEGGTTPENAHFGIRTTLSADSTRFDHSYRDICRPRPYGSGPLSSFTAQTGYVRPWVFTLDNIVSGSSRGGVPNWYYASGSRRRQDSFTAQSGKSLRDLLEFGIDSFTAPLCGGFDGLNIAERDPFRNSQWTNSSTAVNSYSMDALQRAVKTVADPERVITNLITAPGIWRKQVTDDIIDVCENRGDALALIDIEDAGTPLNTEGTAFSTATQRRPSVTGSVTKLRAREINSSYACAYFPWVKVRDPNSSAILDMPPSVVALGTFGSSQASTELWFAPAGFVRGGLSAGAAGLPVTGVQYRLTSKERDTLYASNINPIATFPNEGIVIFGQKTLQVTRSALDRINVRRLMVYVKKEISKMAAGVLFDPNTDVTWGRFTSKANPFLASVKARFGLSDFLVVLDKTTTTDDLVDRNIMYAKIFLKPTKAIEFIALDFIITRQGASFND